MAPSSSTNSSNKKKTTKPTPNPPTDDDAFTPERFTRELQALAAKAQTETWTAHFRSQATLYNRAALLLTLASLSATVSQLALSPVYGGIPSAQHHTRLLMAACFAGWSGNLALNRALPFRAERLLPLVAFWVPVVQFALGKWSGVLTAGWGPVVTEAVTVFPIVAVAVACVATELDGADLGWLPGWVADAAPGLGAYGFFKLAERVVGGAVEGWVGWSGWNTRMGMEVVLGVSYALVAPSRLLLWAVPALLHTALLNTHVPTEMALARLNSGLASAGYVVLDRAESITGYVSVVESPKEGYRVMRCDHSLLGGEWVKFLGQGQFKGNQVAEPIYGVFAMLEAVRLVKTPKPILDEEAKALVM